MKGFDYTKVCRIAFGFNAIPAGRAQGFRAAGARVSCAVAGIKALNELGASLRGLSLEREGRKVTFECDLRPDSYLVYDGGEKAEVRDGNFVPLGEAKLSGDKISLDAGDSHVSFSYTGSRGPAPWSRVEFKCNGPSEAISAR